MDVAQLGISVTSNGVDQATKGLDGLSGAAGRAEKASSDLSKTTGGASGAAAAAAKAYGQQGTAAVSASKQIELMNRAANQNSAAMGGFNSQLRMASMQLSQVAQQVQAGTGFLQAFAIQLPDLALGFGPIGIAAGVAAGAVLTYFSHILSSGPEANLTLAEQAKLIRKVADEWGDAAPKLSAYADGLERLAKANDLLAAANSAAQAQFTPIVDLLSTINQQYVAATQSLRGYGQDSQGVLQNLTTSFANLQSKIMEGRATTDDLKSAQDAMANAVDQFGTPAVQRLAAAFDLLIPQINEAIEKAAGFKNEAASLPGLMKMMDPSTWRSASIDYRTRNQNEGTGTEFAPTPYDGPVPGSRPLIELEGLPKVRGAGRAANDNYKSAILSIQERTKAIQAETAAQAALNPLINDYGFAVTKARTSADLLAAAEKAKKEMTPGLIAQIDETSTALARATAEQNKQAEAVNKYKETVEFLKSTTAGFINDLRNGLRQGEGFWQSLGDAALNVFDRITDRLLNQVMDAIFKVGDAASGIGGNGGVLGGILSLFGIGGGKGTDFFPSKPGIGLYASGTPAARPGLAWVGEKGPELVRFKGGEEVIPNHRIFPAANQNASTANGPQATSQPREIVLRVIGEEGPMFRPTIRSESQDVAVTVVQENNKARQNLYQNGETQYG